MTDIVPLTLLEREMWMDWAKPDESMTWEKSRRARLLRSYEVTIRKAEVALESYQERAYAQAINIIREWAEREMLAQRRYDAQFVWEKNPVLAIDQGMLLLDKI